MNNQTKQAVALSFRNGVEAGINSLSAAQLSELVLAPYLELQSEHLSRHEVAA